MKVNSAMLKIIGMVTMVLLNLTMFGVVKQPALQYTCGILGASSITIFAFLITEGYRRTSNLNKYVLRVAIFALASAFPYHAVMKLVYGEKAGITAYFGAGLTALMCLLTISTYDRLKDKRFKYTLVFMVCLLTFVFDFYWAPFAFILIMIIHVFRDNFPKMAYYIGSVYVAFFIVGLFFKLTNSGYENPDELNMMIYQIGGVLPLPLIYKYNGQEGVKLKWIVYLFYPLMLILFILLLIPGKLDILPLLV